MAKGKADIWVYADWKGMAEPKCIGILSAQQAKGKKAFSFEYKGDWLSNINQRFILDPDINLFGGQQYPNNKENFGVFMDSMPDTWGRTLMKRRAFQHAQEHNLPSPQLFDIDFLLGVFDETRMGALRFKINQDGPFLDNNNARPTPPWSSIRELQHAAKMVDSDVVTAEIKDWLAILIAPGSSLGGARPKANILDEIGNLMIAKFPAKADVVDKAAWEFLAYKLAIQCGIEMSECRIEKISSKYNTFFTRRFDRESGSRIHFSSAMSMTGFTEEKLRDTHASYLDLVDFIQSHGAQPEKDLAQLWRRIVFNICISNTDDHLRNHGFLLRENGWILSPAYDLNPSIDKGGLAMNIDMDNNARDMDLAKSVAPYFRLSGSQSNQIIEDVINSVSKWKTIAKKIGISRSEQELMSPAFMQIH